MHFPANQAVFFDNAINSCVVSNSATPVNEWYDNWIQRKLVSSTSQGYHSTIQKQDLNFWSRSSHNNSIHQTENSQEVSHNNIVNNLRQTNDYHSSKGVWSRGDCKKRRRMMTSFQRSVQTSNISDKHVLVRVCKIFSVQTSSVRAMLLLEKAHTEEDINRILHHHHRVTKVLKKDFDFDTWINKKSLLCSNRAKPEQLSRELWVVDTARTPVLFVNTKSLRIANIPLIYNKDYTVNRMSTLFTGKRHNKVEPLILSQPGSVSPRLLKGNDQKWEIVYLELVAERSI